MIAIIIGTAILLCALTLSIGSFWRQCCIKKEHFTNGLNNYRYMNLIKTVAWGGVALIILIFKAIEFLGNGENFFLTFSITEKILMFFFDIFLIVVAWLDFLFFKGSKFSFFDINKYHRKHD